MLDVQSRTYVWIDQSENVSSEGNPTIKVSEEIVSDVSVTDIDAVIDEMSSDLEAIIINTSSTTPFSTHRVMPEPNNTIHNFRHEEYLNLLWKEELLQKRREEVKN